MNLGSIGRCLVVFLCGALGLGFGENSGLAQPVTTDGLMLWLRADQADELDDAGHVATWKNHAPGTDQHAHQSCSSLWLNADSLPASDDEARIGRWPDDSGYGHDGIQAEPARRPHYVTRGINRRAALDFRDGFARLDFGGWSPPADGTAYAALRRVPHERARIEQVCPAIYRPRDVVWLAGGHLQDGMVHWSQPEVILYGFDQAVRGLGMSYPDFIEQDGRLWITTTDKEDARIFEIDPTLLAGLWDQQRRCSVPVEGLAFEVEDETMLRGGSLELGALPSLLHGGFTIDLAFRLDQVRPGQVLLECRLDSGRGWTVTTGEDQALRLELSDGRHPFEHWSTDTGLLGAGRRHHITWIVDGGPDLILPVVDGVLGDGGAAASGWGRCSRRLTDVTDDGSTLRIAGQLEGRIEHLRIYRRPLRVTEAIGIHRHDKGRSREPSGTQ